MKHFKIYLLLFFSVSLIACNRHALPVKSNPVAAINKDCDSLIAAAMSNVQIKDTLSGCQDNCTAIVLDNVRLAQSLSDCQKYAAQCSTDLYNKPTVFIDKSKTKIKDSFNDITKLKNSIQIRDATIDSLSLANVALHGKVKDLEKIKNKNSSTGANSPVTNKSGNTTSKAPFIAWVVVFVAGMITSLSIRLIIKRFI